MRRNKRLIVAGATALALSMLVLGGGGLRAHGDKDDDDERGFEIWTVDQAGTAGTLYIYDGEDLNENASTAVPEVFDLGATVAPLCLARTGSSPVRGHMMTFSPGDTHAVLAYVATGHVVFLEAATRTPVECIDVGLQAHAAFSSPDGTYVAVANQNGKLLQRIRTNYATNTFVLEAAATLDLATCVTPSGAACQDPARRPDTAPICPVIDSSSRLVFTTLRGGGLFVVDGTATPMRIVAEYDQATVRANGCGGIEQGGRMYVNAGGGTAGNPTENDLYSFRLSAFPFAGSAPPNTPSPRTIYVFDSGSHDGHGALVNRAAHGRYLERDHGGGYPHRSPGKHLQPGRGCEPRSGTRPHGAVPQGRVRLREPPRPLPPDRERARVQQRGRRDTGRGSDQGAGRRAARRAGRRGAHQQSQRALHVHHGRGNAHAHGEGRPALAERAAEVKRLLGHGVVVAVA
jgi:hypothetical protein